jgi:hypothetical protein
MRWIALVIDRLTCGGSIVWAAARRWPAVAVIVAALLVLVLPLCVDLFYAIPWSVRKVGGWVAFSGLLVACVARLWRIDPGDDAPPADTVGVTGWTFLIPPLICAVMAVTYLKGPRHLGAGDWDLYLERYEAVRRTILEWGQFPWWDPWCRGGFPLAAGPHCGVLGIATPLVLALGTSVGMRLAVLACLLIAIEGARRLAWLWFREPRAAVAAGLIYGINGGVLSLSVSGYFLPMSFCSFPWLLYYVFRLDRRPADGAFLGFWLAFNVLNGIYYYSVYSVMILAIVWLRGIRARSGLARTRFLVHTALAAGVLLALAGWRLATTALVYRDFPRHFRSAHDLTPWTIVKYLLTRPDASALATMEVPEFWDTLWYVGPVVLALAAVSLGRGWRWWHTLSAGCIWLAAGSEAWYHPSYWLAHLPLFTTMHTVVHWRIMATLGFALAAVDVLARWFQGGSTALRRLALAAVVSIAVDYGLLGCQVLPLGFRIAPSESQYPGPPTSVPVQVGDSLGFAAVERGYGVIHLREPLLGYDQMAQTARLWRGHPNYVGEYWTEAGPLHPRWWSPNRIVLQVGPGQTVSINQNPGSWWLVNGRPAFSDWRCAETKRAFLVQADASGRVELQIRPRGLEVGVMLHLAGFALIGLGLMGNRLPWAGKS